MPREILGARRVRKEGLPTKPESLNYFRVLLAPRSSRGHCFLVGFFRVTMTQRKGLLVV